MTVEARIRGDIEARIHSGEWKPGYRIPFEHELVTMYGCSRATVSKALGGLAKDGLVNAKDVARAIKEYKLDPEKPNPLTQ